MRKRSRAKRTLLTRALYHERKARKAGFECIAGLDEAGRGPLAGPVCAASVVLKETRFDRKIADSKLLSPRSRDLAYEEITRKAWIGMGSVSHDLIDKINIYNATILAMTRAVKNLDIQPDMLLIDGRIRLSVPWAQKSIVRGDSQSLSIACASIVAKVTRDRMMVAFDKAYPEYGFARHKGYPTREHVRRLRKCGPCPIHRVSFNPVKQVLTASHGRLD